MYHQRQFRRSGRRVVTVSLLLVAVSLVSAPVGRQFLVAYELYRARRALADVELTQAEGWLQAAEERQPDRADVQYWLAVTHRRHAAYAAAEECLRRARALGFTQGDVELQQVLIQFQKGNIAQTEPYLTKLLEKGGDDELAEDIYEAMTIGYIADHRLKDATLCLNYWIQWRPDSLRARLMRAYFYNSAMPSPSLMQDELREVLRIAPGRVAERLAMAELLLHQAQIEEALAECETCRRLAPNDPHVTLEFGLCYFRQGRMEEAKLALESAVEQLRDDDQLAQSYNTLGQIASASRDHTSAVRYYEEAVKHTPNDPAVHYALGVALRTLGKDELAVEQLQQSKILRAQSERMDEIKLAIASDPANIALRVEAAKILREQGRQEEAMRWISSTLSFEPKLKVAHEMLAELFEEHGAREQAERHREAARSGTELAGLDVPGTGKASDTAEPPVGPNASHRSKTPDGSRAPDEH